jgi:alpha-glucosidase
MTEDFLWWQDGIIYQIYPRSYMDNNNDGIGDLPGITSRLDYLADLGVDAIWLSPVYPSPDRDFGYDVSNYVDIDPRYGSLQDFDVLVSIAHKKNIHVIMDLVLNHTSDEHPWFKQSRSSKDNPYRDWYMWHPGKGKGKRPNNWQAVFGGDGWELDPQTNEYYFHMFLKSQPDLNWRNPLVRKAILDVFRFWLDKGVDGFRLDVFNAYFKDADLKDNPPQLGIRGFERQKHIFDIDQSEMMPLLAEIRSLLDQYGERYMVGETFLSNPEKAVGYTGNDRLHAAFNFTMLEIPWNATKFSRAITEWDDLNRGGRWPNNVLNNHDQQRTTNRYKFDKEDQLAKTAATLILTLRGTPFLYYGEEIGMRDIRLSRSEILDPPGKKYWPFYKGRDGCRSPMQWSANSFSGFSDFKPWLPIHPGYVQRNVENHQKNPESLLNFYKELIKLRKATPALQHGSFRLIPGLPASVLCYIRELDNTRMLILLNFQLKPLNFTLPDEFDLRKGTILINSLHHQDSVITSSSQIEMQPGQSLIIDLPS